MHALLKNKKIGVLLGGASHERKISLISGGAVYDALKAQGYTVKKVDIKNRPCSIIKKSDIDIAFVALHGKGGEDGRIQGILDSLRIPYTGAGVRGSINAFDKYKTKKVLEQAKIPTPPYALITKRNWEKVVERFHFPLFIKPLDDGSSIGVHLVSSYKELHKKLYLIFKKINRYLIEERIAGREITVGIVGRRALPIIELKPKHTFYSYETKYTPGMTRYIVPAVLPESAVRRYQRIARRAYQALGMRDFARIDIMLDARGNPSVLECNSIPGFTPTSLLPKAARAAGIDFEMLCERLLLYAMKRR